MFKKLKKRIEDGEDSGIDRLTFSPTKLPGSVVRSRPSVTPEKEASPSPCTSEIVDGEAEEQKQATEDPDLVGGKNTTEISGREAAPLLVQVPTKIPNHLQSSLKADAANEMLLAKIDKLQQEQAGLGEEMEAMKTRHLAERAAWEEDTATRLAGKDQEYHQLEMKADKSDRERTELKLQIVELQLEKDDMQQRLEGEVRNLTEKVKTLEEEKLQEKERLENEISTLKVTLDETERSLMDSEDRVSELEKKVENLDKRVGAYSTSSDNEVIDKLQNEVTDMEVRIRARNVDIEILQSRLAATEREKQDKLQVGIDRQEALAASCKELKEQLTEKDAENLTLHKELEKQNQRMEQKEKALFSLRAEVEEKNSACEELEQQIEEMKLSEVEQVRQEKDAKISELTQALDQMRAELFELQFMQSGRLSSAGNDSFTSPLLPLPPKTNDIQREAENGPAILLVSESQAKDSVSDSLGVGDLDLSGERNGEPATMQSHGLEEELQLLRREQLILQDDLSEKNKIIKVQQQKIMDMRKALNRELKSQSSMDTSRNKREPSPVTRVAIVSDVNFQYLKHVIIKFISSREDEALQLVRAISTLLEFTPEEEQHVRGYLDYKMSWFGTLPPPLYQPLLRRTL